MQLPTFFGIREEFTDSAYTTIHVYYKTNTRGMHRLKIELIELIFYENGNRNQIENLS